jgi:hypothetical protein
MQTVPAINLKDILQYTVPGVQVSNHSIFGSLYASRGCPMLDNSTTQFMWDGMNINSAGSLGINSSLKSSLIGDIARLEVSNGPSSIIHGNGAINGFVNQVPKSGSGYSGLWVNMGIGMTANRLKAETGYGHAYGVDRDLYFYAGIERADGIDLNEDFGYREFSGADAIPEAISARTMSKPNYRASLNWNHNNIHVIGFIQKEYLSLDNYYDGQANSPELYLQTLALRPGIILPLTNSENLSIDLPLAFFDTGYITKRSDSGSINEHGNSDMRIETNWILRSTRWKNQQWATGFRVSGDHYRNNRYYFSSGPSPSPLGTDVDWKEFSVFTEGIIDILPAWTVTSGLRFDAIRYDVDASDGFLDQFVSDAENWFPRIATTIRLRDNTTVKLSFQEGFHYPQATAVYSDHLDTEFLETYELNVSHAMPHIGLTINLNGFYNIYKNALVAASADSYKDFGSTGGELALEWEGNNAFRAILSYAYTRPIDAFGNDADVYTATPDLSAWISYPTHSVKALISRRWLNDTILTSLAGEYGYRVERIEWSPSRDIFDKDRYSLGFKTAITLSKHLSLNVVINNIVHNDIPVPSYQYLEAWQGNLGETETRCYVGLTWK